MATQKVTEKILNDANKEAKEILSKYKKEAAQIRKEYEERIGIRKQQIESDLETMKDNEILRTVSQKRMELNRAIVAEKRKYIRDVIEDALKGLSQHKGYIGFLKELIKKSGEKKGELIISKHDWQRHGAELEKFMKKEDLNYKVTQNNEITGGVLIKKEKTTYHGSLDLIRELLNDELTIAVSKALYKDKKSKDK